MTDITQTGAYFSGIFEPVKVGIKDVTRAIRALVTTVIPHTFVIGLLVRFVVPTPYGINQMNGEKGYVISVPTNNTFLVSLDTRLYDPFNPVGISAQNPIILPIGGINTGITGTPPFTQEEVGIPGQFRNFFL